MTSESSSKGSKGQGLNVNMPGSQSPTEVGTVVYVTQEDIDTGEPGECGTCPVAIAANRATGLWASVSNFSLCLFDYKPDQTTSFLSHPAAFQMELPEIVVQFIYAFDDGTSVSPFSFTIPYSGDSK